MSIDTRKRLAALDALRGIAVLMVVIFHATTLNEQHVFKYGAIGVELFFIISGFVIFMTISKVSSGKEFIAKRFARLYPIYWVCVSLTFLLHLFTEPATTTLLGQYAVNMTMLQRYFDIPDLDGPYWSLAIELAFYLFIYVLYKMKLLGKAEGIFLAAVLIEFGLMIIRRIKEGANAVTYVAPTEHIFGIFHFLPLFLAGIVFYKIYTEGANVKRYTLIVVCYITQIWEYPNRHVDMYNLRAGDYELVLAAMFILLILFVNNLLGFIVNRVTLFLGRISYALYLFHQYLMVHFIIPFLYRQLHLPYFISALCAIITVIAIGSINTFFIDEPLRNSIKRAINKKAPEYARSFR